MFMASPTKKMDGGVLRMSAFFPPPFAFWPVPAPMFVPTNFQRPLIDSTQDVQEELLQLAVILPLIDPRSTNRTRWDRVLLPILRPFSTIACVTGLVDFKLDPTRRPENGIRATVRVHNLSPEEQVITSVAVQHWDNIFQISPWQHNSVIQPNSETTLTITCYPNMKATEMHNAWLLVTLNSSEVLGSHLILNSKLTNNAITLNAQAQTFVPSFLGHQQKQSYYFAPLSLPPQPILCIKRRELDRHEPPYMFREESVVLSRLYQSRTSNGVWKDGDLPINIVENTNKLTVPAVHVAYVPHFLVLLAVEEAQMIRDMRMFTKFNVSVEVTEDQLLRVHVPGLQEWRPPVDYGDRVRLTAVGGSFIIDAYVLKVERRPEFLLLSVNILLQNILQLRFNVEFIVNRRPLLEMRRALQRIQVQQKQSGKSFMDHLLPTNHKRRPVKNELRRIHLRLIDKELNWEQSLSIQQVVEDTKTIQNGSDNASYLHIIYGPPGTGKTRAVIELVLQLLRLPKEQRLLVTAPSNQACDILVNRLALHLTSSQMLRFNAFTRTFDEVPLRVQQFSNPDPDNRFFDIPSLGKLKSYRVIVATCISSGLLYDAGLERGYFTHIILDESGQAMEPESLVPLSFADELTMVVMAGDHMQLGPAIRSPAAINHNLGQSLQERVMRSLHLYGSAVTWTPLKRNYRSHPKLLYLPSHLFYGDTLEAFAPTELINSARTWSALPNPDFPLMFVGVQGEEFVDSKAGLTLTNPVEVARIVPLIQSLLAEVKVSAKQVAVISPFRNQVKLIRQSLRDVGLSGVSVGIVEDYQGQEHQFVFISTVRSSMQHLRLDAKHNLGLLNNPKRFNVATTRAQALLVVVGNPYILLTDPRWRSFLTLSKRNNVYTGCPFPAQLENEVASSSDLSKMEQRSNVASDMQSTKKKHWLGAGQASIETVPLDLSVDSDGEVDELDPMVAEMLTLAPTRDEIAWRISL